MSGSEEKISSGVGAAEKEDCAPTKAGNAVVKKKMKATFFIEHKKLS